MGPAPRRAAAHTAGYYAKERSRNRCGTVGELDRGSGLFVEEMDTVVSKTVEEMDGIPSKVPPPANPAQARPLAKISKTPPERGVGELGRGKRQALPIGSRAAAAIVDNSIVVQRDDHGSAATGTPPDVCRTGSDPIARETVSVRPGAFCRPGKESRPQPTALPTMRTEAHGSLILRISSYPKVGTGGQRQCGHKKTGTPRRIPRPGGFSSSRGGRVPCGAR